MIIRRATCKKHVKIAVEIAIKRQINNSVNKMGIYYIYDVFSTNNSHYEFLE